MYRTIIYTATHSLLPVTCLSFRALSFAQHLVTYRDTIFVVWSLSLVSPRLQARLIYRDLCLLFGARI